MIINPYRFAVPVTYTTWNPSDKSGDIALSGGNLIATHTGTNADMVRAILGIDPSSAQGRKFEVTLGTNPSTTTYPHRIGLSQSGESLTAGVGASTTGYAVNSSNGNKVNNNNLTAYGTGFTSGDVIGVYWRNGKIFFSLNGTVMNSGDLAAETGFAFSGLTGTKYPAWSCDASGSGATPDPVVTVNFGASAWAYDLDPSYIGIYS